MTRCGSQSIANYRKREAELLFALVGDARSLLFPVAVAPHPTRVLEGIEQFSRSGSQRHGDLDEPSLPRQVHRVTQYAQETLEQTLRKLCSHLTNRAVWLGPP